MSSTNGLMGAAAFRKPGVPYYLQEGAEIVSPEIRAPIQLKSPDENGEAVLTVGDFAAGVAGPYTGAIFLEPGPSSAGTAKAGLAIRSGAAGTIVEVGANAEGPNLLGIAGASGVGQVYDEIYNQPVALQTITIVASDPDCTPTGGAEIFRCGQAAVAQAGAGTVQFNRIQVPRSGAYMMQTQINMGNGPGANTVVLPSTLVGGVPVWNALQISMQEFGTVILVPYAGFEVIGGDFQAIDTFASSSFTVKTYSTVVFLDATKVYAISLASNSPLWNIGDAGQIKVELIAMC